MTVLHFDFISRSGPPSFLFDALLGSDVSDVARDVEVMKSFLVTLFKAHKFNTRASSSYADEVVSDLLKVAPSNDAFRATVSISIDIGNEVVVESVKAEPTAFLLTLQ